MWDDDERGSSGVFENCIKLRYPGTYCGPSTLDCWTVGLCSSPLSDQVRQANTSHRRRRGGAGDPRPRARRSRPASSSSLPAPVWGMDVQLFRPGSGRYSPRNRASELSVAAESVGLSPRTRWLDPLSAQLPATTRSALTFPPLAPVSPTHPVPVAPPLRSQHRHPFSLPRRPAQEPQGCIRAVREQASVGDITVGNKLTHSTPFFS